MKAITRRATFLGALALTTPSVAQSAPKTPSMEQLQRDVQALENRLLVLDSAAREIAQLTVRTAEILSRVLSERSGAPLAAGDAVAGDPSKPEATATRPSTAIPGKKEPAKKEPSTRVFGSVRGKVKLPAGEPIAYVYVENVLAPPVRGKTVVIDQKNKSFAPGWAVIRRGTTVEFPNHDKIYHNVFSHAAGNSFDLGLYNAGSPAKSHTFQAAGAVDIYCNIHPSMSASVLVVPNDLYAKVQPDGTFAIDRIPTGQRKIVAWSPGNTPAVQWLELGSNETANVELTLVSKSRVHANKAGRAHGSYE
jgi:plastocyanin